MEFTLTKAKSDAEASMYSNWAKNSYGEKYFSKIQS